MSSGDAATEHRRRRALAALCATEITSWGVLYYAFPVILGSLSAETGWSSSTALSVYSAGLLVSALVGVPVGRLLDRHGPRPVMTAGSVLGVVSLLAAAAAPGLGWFLLAWAAVGVAQAMLLYPPAFAALTRWYGEQRVRAITTLSLAGGLASTVFAPPTAFLVGELGWRGTLAVLAGVLGLVTLPLHALFLTPPWPRGATAERHEEANGVVRSIVRGRRFLLLVLALVLASAGLFGATMNLVPMLTGAGVPNTLAATAFGLVGVGQVLGRIGYPALTRRTGPAARTAVILAVGAATVAALALAPRIPIAGVFGVALCAGAARGVYTLLQATAVSDRWGTRHYATLSGLAIAPATAAMALAPAGGAWLAELLGGYSTAFAVLSGLTLIGAAAGGWSGVPEGGEQG